MATNYKITVRLNGAYAVDEQLLDDIHQAARSFVGSGVKTEIECSDAHKIAAEQLADALDDAILRAHAITSIRISGSDYKAEPSRRFSFKARDDIFLPTFELELEGNHTDCAAITSQLEKLTKVKRQWYSPLVLNGTVSSSVVTVVVYASSSRPLSR
jgi:hypothetical protein